MTKPMYNCSQSASIPKLFQLSSVHLSDKWIGNITLVSRSFLWMWVYDQVFFPKEDDII